MPSLELTVADYKGRELDPIIKQASHQFLLDDRFIKFGTFHQFAWWENIGKFEERCNKLRIKHPKMEETAL